mmetsp:Transcript_23052/g.46641  ORF Transcript_23052/g.46641 Transcript_23052/m.46641 type:complete len:143 (-) Transcript_23052:37-465(-)
MMDGTAVSLGFSQPSKDELRLALPLELCEDFKRTKSSVISGEQLTGTAMLKETSGTDPFFDSGGDDDVKYPPTSRPAAIGSRNSSNLVLESSVWSNSSKRPAWQGLRLASLPCSLDRSELLSAVSCCMVTVRWRWGVCDLGR